MTRQKYSKELIRERRKRRSVEAKELREKKYRQRVIEDKTKEVDFDDLRDDYSELLTDKDLRECLKSQVK